MVYNAYLEPMDRQVPDRRLCGIDRFLLGQRLLQTSQHQGNFLTDLTTSWDQANQLFFGIYLLRFKGFLPRIYLFKTTWL
jgi:hypothetical protein